jgi:RNA ligase
MLHVQTWLRAGKTHQQLTDELGIHAIRHPELPLVILDYDQIDSPRGHPVVRECRGIVLHAETHDLIARSFPRFFNWGEMQDDAKKFDFASFSAHTKEDGSLILLFFFGDTWHASTRASFALDRIYRQEITWHEGLGRALGITSLAELKDRLDPSVSYVCEFCSPWNVVVRRYSEPTLYLLSAFRGEAELPIAEVDELARPPFRRPLRHDFTSIEAIQEFLHEQASADPTFEGVVVRDRNDQRWKIKSPTYLGLHQMASQGEDAYSPKHLLPFILAGEDSELLTYHPEARETYLACKEKVEQAWNCLLEVWQQTWQIEDQKNFAQAIQGRTPFVALLFALRKSHGRHQTREQLGKLWRNSAEMILRSLFR